MTKRVTTVNSNGNGEGHLPKVWVQVGVSSAIALVGGLLAVLWSLADPRTDLSNIRSNYLSLREHAAFQEQVKANLDRLDKVEIEQSANLLPIKTFEVYKMEHDNVLRAMQAQIDNLQHQLQSLESDRRR